MKKLFKNKLFIVFIALTLLLTCFTFCFLSNSENKANAAANDIVVTDNFKKTDENPVPRMLTDGTIYEYSNVCTSPGKDSGFGIIAAESWGPFVKTGNGYVTYKIAANDGYVLGKTSLTFSARHGHQSQGELYGAGTSNVRVYISYDNVKWRTTYDLASSMINWASSKEYFNLPVDCSYLFEGQSVVYVKFCLLNPAPESYPAVFDSRKQDGKIDINLVTATLIDVNLTAKQVEKTTGDNYARINVVYGGITQTYLVKKGTSIYGISENIPQGFVRENAKFYLDEACTTECSVSSLVEGNAIYYVKGSVAAYGVSYVLDGGTNNGYNKDVYYQAEGLKLYAPEKSGYTFIGWYSDAAFTDRIEEIAQGSMGDKTVYAKWQKNYAEAHGATENGGCSGNVDVSLVSAVTLFVLAAFVVTKRLLRKKK